MRLKLRRLTSICLVIVMLSAVFLPTIAEAADGTPEFTITISDTTLTRGDTFTVTVSLDTNNSGVGGIESELRYDSSSLEAVSGSTSLQTVGFSYSNAGRVKYVYANGFELNHSGALYTVTFKVKDTAAGALSSFKLLGADDGAREPLEDLYGSEIASNIAITNSGFVTVDVPVQSIAVEPTSIDIYEGKESQLTVVYTPEDTTHKTITWSSSNEDIVRVSNTGRIVGVSRGSAIVTATTDNGLVAQTEVNVKREIGSIILSNYSLTMDKGSSKQLTATLPDDADGDKTITWSTSDASVATVDENGNVEAVGKGTATITATTANGKTATCSVWVGVLLKGIAFENNVTEKTLNMGIDGENNFDLSVVLTPEDADVDLSEVVWNSTDTSVATVQDGKVTAIGGGDTKITATLGEFEATCDVHVNVPILSISTKDKVQLTYGEQEKLEIKYNTYNNIETTEDKTIKWEIADASIADISVDGTITTKKPGTTKVTATLVANPDVTATIDLTIGAVPLTAVIIEEQSIVMEKEDTKQLTLKFNPENTSDSKDVTWTSSDPSVVTVDSNGKISALSNGNATITVKTEGGLEATTQVKVQTTLKDIILSQTDITINKDVPLTLSVKLDPVDATLDDSTIRWTSSNEEVATVNENGDVTTLKAGTVYIYATVGGITKECKITVNVPLTGISTDETVSLLKGQQKQLVVTKEPEGTNFGGKITYESSDTKLVSVDKDGVILAIAKTEDTPVTITINAVENDVVIASTTCLVDVTEIPLNSITISQADFELGLGRTQKLSVLYNPENTTDDKDVVWTSSNPEIASVTSDGTVTALTVGEVYITATVGDKTATVLVTTHEIEITGIKVYTNLSNNKLAVGTGVTLTVKTIPEDATRQGNYKFTSSDTSILTVDEQGNVVAHKVGKTLITVETENGIKEQVEIEVVSNSAAAAEEYKRLSPQTGDINIEAFTAIMIVSAIGLAALVITNKKNK